MKVSDNTSVSMPMRNLISILGATALGVWAYFGVIERLNNIETQGKLMLADVDKNTEFRIKWPRGEMGSLPADAQQDMRNFSISCCALFIFTVLLIIPSISSCIASICVDINSISISC